MRADPVRAAQEAIVDGGMTLHQTLPAFVREILADGLWRARRDEHGRPFRDFPAFVEHGQWEGLGIRYSDLIRHCEAVPDVRAALEREYAPLAKHGDVNRIAGHETAGSAQVSVTNLGNKTIPDRSYVMRRLARDAKEDPKAARLVEAIAAGKATPHAAALEMGWRKKRDPLNTTLAAIQRIDDREALERIAEAIATRLMEIG